MCYPFAVGAAAQLSASRFTGEVSGNAVRLGIPAISGRRTDFNAASP